MKNIFFLFLPLCRSLLCVGRLWSCVPLIFSRLDVFSASQFMSSLSLLGHLRIQSGVCTDDLSTYYKEFYANQRMLLLLMSAAKVKDFSHILDVGHGASGRKGSRSQPWIQAGSVKSREPVICQLLMLRTCLAMFWLRLWGLTQVLEGFLQHTDMLYIGWQLWTANKKPTDPRVAAVASRACGNPTKSHCLPEWDKVKSSTGCMRKHYSWTPLSKRDKIAQKQWTKGMLMTDA